MAQEATRIDEWTDAWAMTVQLKMVAGGRWIDAGLPGGGTRVRDRLPRPLSLPRTEEATTAGTASWD